MKVAKKLFLKYVLYLAWITAIASTAGSLIFSEILGYTPCILCWYQRIAMYPLVVIIAIGIILKDKKLAFYALPLSIVGGVIALLQYLLQLGVLTEASFPCRVGVSCTTKYVNYFGFVTIPFLSLIAFIFINICLLYYWRTKK